MNRVGLVNGDILMRIINCPQCDGNGFITLGHRHPKCGYCHGNKRVTSEFVKWEKMRLEFHNDLKEQLKAIMELKEETALKKWLAKNKKPRKFPKT